MELPEGYLTMAELAERIAAAEEDDKAAVVSDLVLAQILDAATEYREEIRALDAKSKKMKEIFKYMELGIIKSLENAGTPEQPLLVAGGLSSTATLSITDVPTVENWDLVEEWIYDNRALHLVQRRISAKIWETTVGLEGDIPGIKTFEQRKISLRKTKRKA
jgi:hypothetical protein